MDLLGPNFFVLSSEAHFLIQRVFKRGPMFTVLSISLVGECDATESAHRYSK